MSALPQARVYRFGPFRFDPVVSLEKFNYWCDTPGNVYFEAATEGEVLYEAA